MLRLRALIAVFCVFPNGAWAACPLPDYEDPRQVSLTSQSALIVTHASDHWDIDQSSKSGIDRTVDLAKKNGIPVVYLNDASGIDTYFYSDCSPTHYIYSRSGGFDFSITSPDVTVVGGFIDVCLKTTVETVFSKWGKLAKKDRRLTLVTDAVYSGRQTWPPRNLEQLLSGAARWERLEFLRDYADTLRLLPSGYSIVLSLDGIPEEVLHRGPPGSPTLEINLARELDPS